ncbi:MAG: carboxypeptidase-like regulatory domain-containing protein, partial [Planctomycetota bacterium]
MSQWTTTLFALAAMLPIHGSSGSGPPQAKTGPDEEPRWQVSGRVVESGTGRPLAGMRARVLLPKVPYAWMIPAGNPLTTDSDGRFRDSVSWPATYVLNAAEVEMPNTPSPGREPSRPRLGQVYRPLAVGVPPRDATECEIALGPAASARLTVTDGSGVAVEGASVVALSEDAPHPIQLLDCARTDERGRAEYVGLGQGSWRLLAFRKGIGAGSVDLPGLKWGEKREAVMRLAPCGELFVACRLRGPSLEEDLGESSAVM